MGCFLFLASLLSVMPYEKTEDLPPRVKDNLPEEAEKIFRAAYNSAWEEYADPERRRGEESREEVANKVAWAAVKQKFEKRNGEWVRLDRKE
jgi:cation transport regulator